MPILQFPFLKIRTQISQFISKQISSNWNACHVRSDSLLFIDTSINNRKNHRNRREESQTQLRVWRRGFCTLLLYSCSSAVQRCGSLVRIHFHWGKVTLLLYKIIILMQLIAFLATPVPPLEMFSLSYNCSCWTVLVELKPHSFWVQAGWWNKKCLASFFITVPPLLLDRNGGAQITNCCGQPSERIPLRLVQWEDATFPVTFKMPCCILQYFSWKPPLPRLSHHPTSHSAASALCLKDAKGKHHLSAHFWHRLLQVIFLKQLKYQVVSPSRYMRSWSQALSSALLYLVVFPNLASLDHNIQYVHIYFYLLIHCIFAHL